MIIRPRLNDYYNLPFTQNEADFAIPFLDEDIPLYVDPFLLWKSPSQQDNALHSQLINSFNNLGRLFSTDETKAIEILINISECDEVGLGESPSKKGKKIGKELACNVLSIYKDIPQINKQGLSHFEEIQLLVENISKDRISDISANILKSFLIDYTIQQCEKFQIPTQNTEISYFDLKNWKIISEKISLPCNPNLGTPILFVPKRWLRFIPWINFEDYFANYISTSDRLSKGLPINRVEILEYNRKNYGLIQGYIKAKLLVQKDCKNDPLFTQIPILSSKRKLTTILGLSTGKTDNADLEYERNISPLLASMLYPELDFAQTQSRTDSGVLIRDLIFYNNISHPLMKEFYEKYECKQIVFELKNVNEMDSTHINQLNRYLTNEFGKIGIIFTRNKPPKNVYKNTIDLWAGQRRCILIMDDEDLKIMCQVYENKQRNPIDVINKKYREFMRSCPS